MDLYVVILLGTALTVFIAVWAILEFTSGAQQNRELAQRSAMLESEKRSVSLLGRFDRRLRRTDLGQKIKQRIQRSGLNINLASFVLVMIVAGIAAIVLVWNILAPVFGIGAAVLVGFLFFSYLKHHEERRKEEFTGQLPEVARVLSNATSAGLALPTAIDMAAEELEAPAGSELRRTAESLKVGRSFDEAMRELRDRMPSREIGILISTLIVSSRSGGALVSALRTISNTLEERKETRREVNTILGETTSTAWVLTGLTVSSLFLVNFLFPGAVEKMTQELIGQGILVISGTLLIAGIFLIRRVTRFDF